MHPFQLIRFFIRLTPLTVTVIRIHIFTNSLFQICNTDIELLTLEPTSTSLSTCCSCFMVLFFLYENSVPPKRLRPEVTPDQLNISSLIFLVSTIQDLLYGNHSKVFVMDEPPFGRVLHILCHTC